MKLKLEKSHLLGFCIFFALALIGLFAKSEKIAVLAFLSLPFALFAEKAFLEYLKNKKTKSIENSLPEMLITASSASSFVNEGDFLLFLTQNSSGELKRELKIALAQSRSGMPVRKALKKIWERNKSELIERAMKIISTGIENGAEMAETYLKTAEEFSEIIGLEREKNSTVIMHKITLIAGCLIVPFIIGNVVSLNQGFESDLLEGLKDTQKINIEVIGIVYTAEFCIMSCFFIGSLDGAWKKSFFYITMLLPLSLLSFWLSAGSTL